MKSLLYYETYNILTIFSYYEKPARSTKMNNVYYYEIVMQFRSGEFHNFTAQGEQEAKDGLNDLAAQFGGRNEISGVWIWLNESEDFHLEFKSAHYGDPLVMTAPTGGRLSDQETNWCLNESMTLLY